MGTHFKLYPMTERLEIASRVLPGLILASAGQVFIDKGDTVHANVRLSLKYADKMMELKDKKLEDIKDTPPVGPAVSPLLRR